MRLADRLGLGPKRTEMFCGNGMVDVTVTPNRMLGLPPQTIRLTRDQYHRYQVWLGDNSKGIQQMFPDLTASQREILLTGIGPKDWDRITGDD